MKNETKHLHLFESWRAHKDEILLEGSMKHIMMLAKDAASFSAFKDEVKKFLKDQNRSDAISPEFEESLKKTFDKVKSADEDDE